MSKKFKLKSATYLLWISLFLVNCQPKESDIKEIQQWKEFEMSFTAGSEYANPYTDVEFWVEFTGPDNQKLIRPGYWEQGNTWKVRFASPVSEGEWSWTSFASNESDSGLHGKTGKLKAVLYTGDNELIQNGLLQMSPGKRNVIHANGKPFLMIGDTPWALPFRATEETARVYAENRQNKGFNTALLMIVQPDQRAEGPRDRSLPGSFGVGFEDLSEGHLNKLNPEYFLQLDKLIEILVEHEIVPVYSPVFQGYGWKGLGTLGGSADPNEYVRFVKYLIARYGSYPAMWLANADAAGRGAVVEPAGETFHQWDAYGQPTGNHYSPYDETLANWTDDPAHGLHHNRVHQDKDWLDFQWCQTGHGGDHQSWKVEKMYNNLPAKASANGEPTYEGINDSTNGAGWWQGHEAWLNYMNGGTMGVVYGAGGLWNWKLSADEPGWADWANSNVSWREAIELPGADYVGYLGKALEGLDITDIEKHPKLADGNLCLAKPGELFIIYLPQGGATTVNQLPKKGTYRWFDPKKGKFIAEGKTNAGTEKFTAPLGDASVLIIEKSKQD